MLRYLTFAISQWRLLTFFQRISKSFPPPPSCSDFLMVPNKLLCLKVYCSVTKYSLAAICFCFQKRYTLWDICSQTQTLFEAHVLKKNRYTLWGLCSQTDRFCETYLLKRIHFVGHVFFKHIPLWDICSTKDTFYGTNVLTRYSLWGIIFKNDTFCRAYMFS